MNWISQLSEKIRLRSYVHELDIVFFPLTDARMFCRPTQWLDSVQSYFEPDFRRPIIYSIQETFYGIFKSSNRTCFCIYCAGLPLFFYVNVLDGRVALESIMTGYSKNTVERCSTLKGLLCEWPQGVLLCHVPHSLLSYWKQRPEYSQKLHLLCSTDKIKSRNFKTMWGWVNDDWIVRFFGWIYLKLIDPHAFPALSASLYSLCAGWRSRWLHSYSLSV